MLQYVIYKIYLLKYKILAFLTINTSVILGFKIIMSIIFLIIMRVGVPRFRYDHLSKLG